MKRWLLKSLCHNKTKIIFAWFSWWVFYNFYLQRMLLSPRPWRPIQTLLSPQSHQDSKLDLKQDSFVKDMPTTWTKVLSTHLCLEILFLREQKEEKLSARSLYWKKCHPISPSLLTAYFWLCYLGDSALIFSFWALQGF